MISQVQDNDLYIGVLFAMEIATISSLPPTTFLKNLFSTHNGCWANSHDALWN